ncbi:MAG: hypothetical protein QM796_11125 [Chthoniobacteraceae bacterium]
MSNNGLPEKQGLYDPQFEHDACGVGFVVYMKGKKSHEIVSQALEILLNLDHRGAVGAETIPVTARVSSFRCPQVHAQGHRPAGNHPA